MTKTPSYTEYLVRRFASGTTVTLADLKTLDPNIPSSEIAILEEFSDGFVVGGLSDKIVDFYINYLCDRLANEVKCLCLSSALSQLVEERNIDSAINEFKALNFHKYHQILMPGNPSGWHWILFTVDQVKGIIEAFDPTIIASSQHNNDAEIARRTHYTNDFAKILQNITGTQYEVSVTSFPERDGTEDGIRILYYAERFLNGEKVTDDCDTMNFRLKVYNSILNE